MKDTDTTQEFQIMRKAGLDINDILDSLTTAPSAALKVSNHQAALIASYQADLTILNSDPRIDVTAFADINMVIKKGIIVYQQ